MYHVNPKTGDAGPCKAQKGKCPFGGADEHFTSVEGARAYYETLQRTTFSPTGTSVGEEVVVDIPEHNLQLAKDSIAIANRRLEKAGVEERFTYEVEEYMATEEDPRSGLLTAEPRVKITLNTPSVKYEGYTFMAAVEKAEAGFVVKAASGVNLGGYSPDSLKCEACGKTIGRQKTYLVEDSDSRLIQIGSSCVKNYFGVEPKGLWALTYDPIARARNNDRWGLSTNPMDRALPTEELLAYALAVSNGGENFVSGSAATNYGGVSTAENVRTALWGKDNGYSREIQEAVPSYRAEAKRILEKLKNSDQSTDYGRNMAVIAAGEWTRRNHMNILIGGLSTLGAEKRQAKKDAHLAKWGTPAPGFIGAEKDKISGKKLKVYSVFRDKRPDPNPYSDREIDVTRITFRDEDNHEVVWWASRDIAVEEDDEVTVKSGVIKKLSNFRGVDQTTLTRVRLEGL